MKTEQETTPVPEFADLNEVAEYWDSHSPLDFLEHFEEVDIAGNRPTRKRGISRTRPCPQRTAGM